MNRRGFLGLIGKLFAVGAAMGVSPSLLTPAQEAVTSWTGSWAAADAALLPNEWRTAVFEVTLAVGELKSAQIEVRRLE